MMDDPLDVDKDLNDPLKNLSLSTSPPPSRAPPPPPTPGDSIPNPCDTPSTHTPTNGRNRNKTKTMHDPLLDGMNGNETVAPSSPTTTATRTAAAYQNTSTRVSVTNRTSSTSAAYNASSSRSTGGSSILAALTGASDTEVLNNLSSSRQQPREEAQEVSGSGDSITSSLNSSSFVTPGSSKQFQPPARTRPNASSLLASLTGAEGSGLLGVRYTSDGNDDDDEEDLFGKVNPSHQELFDDGFGTSGDASNALESEEPGTPSLSNLMHTMNNHQIPQDSPLTTDAIGGANKPPAVEELLKSQAPESTEEAPLFEPEIEPPAATTPTIVGATTTTQSTTINPPPSTFYRDHDASLFLSDPLSASVMSRVKDEEEEEEGDIHQFSYSSYSTNNANTQAIYNSIVASSSAHNNNANGDSAAAQTSGIGVDSAVADGGVPLTLTSNFNTSKFLSVSVTDPRYISKGAGGNFLSPITGASHWVYTVTSVQRLDAPLAAAKENGNKKKESNLKTSVPRRFRHFDALECRLRECCPGAILPPRPSKHTAQQTADAQTRQSPAFASMRAKELDQYLNELIHHPIAGNSPALTFFLTFFDDIGTAWPEVSGNALARLAAWKQNPHGDDEGGRGDGEGGLKQLMSPHQGARETNTAILELYISENQRLNHVAQAVPKLEHALTTFHRHNKQMGNAGMEYSKSSKEIASNDSLLSQPLDILAVTYLRSARRAKRLLGDLDVAVFPFVQEIRIARMERKAFHDRRNALEKHAYLKFKAETKTRKLTNVMNSSVRSNSVGGRPDGREHALDRMELDAAQYDSKAIQAMKHAEEVGKVLGMEVRRLHGKRHREWKMSLRMVATNMKDSFSEQKAIWKEAREEFLNAFPEMGRQDGGSRAQ